MRKLTHIMDKYLQPISRLETAIPLLVKELQLMEKQNHLPICIAFPDEGAHKRFSRAFPQNFEQAVCSKTRVDTTQRVIKIREGNVANKHVIIVDDLVQTGGTLLECARVLKKEGAAAISAFVTHPVFPNDSWKSFTPDLFESFWITDSLPHALDISKNVPFKLLSLAPLIANSLLDFELQQR